uniref:Uncharacterized protein n=1 Tax=Manihot esculenta TaxID=3983 RepID=A0A2C9VH74_MANES
MFLWMGVVKWHFIIILWVMPMLYRLMIARFHEHGDSEQGPFPARMPEP